MTDNPYDLVPYLGHSHAQTHPDQLCSLGRLFGLEAADPRQARVLELGCAKGANLIPMAHGLPESEFLGVDLSGIQIEEGQSRIEHLGLENIRLEHRSITEVDEEDGLFDYIICHGVFSWVAPEIQRKIFEICRERLAPHGVAQISFNTLPGWNMVKSLREMAIYHTRGLAEPKERISQARALVGFVTEALADRPSPYASFLQAEMNLLSRVDDSYLYHEHLEDENRPIYFHQFMSAARSHGLDYLADCDLPSMLPENMAEPTAEKLREIDDIVRMEQYMDFLRNRRFRNTLLCHAERELNRDLKTVDLKPFLLGAVFTTPRELESKHLEEGVRLTFDLGAMALGISDRVAKAAISVLGAAGRERMSYEELVQGTAEMLEMDDLAEVERRIDEEINLCRLLFAGAIWIYTLPCTNTLTIEERPVASELARIEARSGVRVTSLRHESVALGLPERVVIQYLDGTNDLDALVAQLQEHIDKGELQLEQAAGEPPTGEAADQLLREMVGTMLEAFRDRALLVPGV